MTPLGDMPDNFTLPQVKKRLFNLVFLSECGKQMSFHGAYLV